MSRPKGLPKTGGRTIGVPNRKTATLSEKCDRLGFDPFHALIETAQNHIDSSIRFSALKELCSYLYPKRKAIEHVNAEDKKITVTLQDWTSDHAGSSADRFKCESSTTPRVQSYTIP